MRRVGSFLCAAAALMGVWLLISLYVGPPDRGLPLPVDAVLAFAGIAALLGSAGMALRRRSAVAAILLLGIGAPLLNSRLIGSQDTEPAAELVFRVVRERTLKVPGPAGWAMPLGDGTFASRYPVATPLLALPVALPASLGHGALTLRFRNVVEKLCASVLTGLMLALLFLAQRRVAGPRSAAIASVLVLLGTAALPVLGQALWQHTGAALALAAGLASLGLPETRTRSLAVGFCAGLAVACRPPDLPLALGLLWLARRPLATAGAAVPVALTLLYQALMFGSALRTGYGDEASIGWRPPWPDGAVGFAGLWVSPARGLLVCYPILVFALWGLWRRPALRALALAVLAESLLIACWWAWDGGWSLGPRMLADATPYFGLGLAVAVEASAVWRRAARACLTGAAALSCATAMALTYVYPRPHAAALVRELRSGAWTPRAWPLHAWFFAR